MLFATNWLICQAMISFIEISVSADDDGRRLDRFIRHYFQDLSQGDIEKLLRSKMIRLDGKKAKADTRIAVDNIIRYPDFLIPTPKENFNSLSPNNVTFPNDIILYEDADLMVINKPHGLAVQGGSNTKIHLDMMLETLPKRNGYRPSPVHRLDKDTSGCLLIAKKRSIAASLGEALKNREFTKYYLALTENVPKIQAGTIETYIAKSQKGNKELMQVVDENAPKALYAKSVYLCTSESSSKRYAVQVLMPITGRTHQLRVHCAYQGTPIIGDPKYNPDYADNAEQMDEAKKLCLHATRLVFTHPKTQKIIEINAPLPEHFHKIADVCGLSLKNYLSHDNKEMLAHFSEKQF